MKFFNCHRKPSEVHFSAGPKSPCSKVNVFCFPILGLWAYSLRVFASPMFLRGNRKSVTDINNNRFFSACQVDYQNLKSGDDSLLKKRSQVHREM